MVLGLPSGMVSGFVDRWKEIDEEKSATAAAHSKAAQKRLDNWMKLHPIEAVINNKLKIKAYPAGLPSELKAAYMLHEEHAGKSALEKKALKYFTNVSEGKIPAHNETLLHLKVRANKATPVESLIYSIMREERLNPGSQPLLVELGGWDKVFETGRKVREDKRRDRVVKENKAAGMNDLHSHWGPVGEAIKIDEGVRKKSSILGSPGVFGGGINVVSGDAAGIMNESHRATQMADLQILKNINDLLDPARHTGFRKFFINNHNNMKTDVKNWMSIVGSRPLIGRVGTRPVEGDGAWLKKAMPHITTALNEKIPSAKVAQESMVKAEIPHGTVTKNIRHNDRIHSARDSDYHNNLSHMRKTNVSQSDLAIAYAFDFKGTKAAFKPQELKQVDPMSGLTYEQSIDVRDALNKYLGSTINAKSSEEYVKSITRAMPSVLNHDTHIANHGAIFKMTMAAIEAKELVHFGRSIQNIGPGINTENINTTSSYDQHKYSTKVSSQQKELSKHTERTSKLNEMSDELGVILAYLKPASSPDHVKLDDAILNTNVANVTGFAAGLSQMVTSGLIEARKTLAELAGIRSLGWGSGSSEDERLKTSLNNSHLDENNRSMLRRLSDRVKQTADEAEGRADTPSNRLYLQRAVIEFKKLALTYKLSGMVQGEATGGRTISNQDFDVMLKALWGTQEASGVRLQSLLQRIETLKTINQIEQSAKLRGTHGVLLNHKVYDGLRKEMHNSFHRNLRNNPEITKHQERASVIDENLNLTGRSRSPERFTKTLENLARDLNDPTQFKRIGATKDRSGLSAKAVELLEKDDVHFNLLFGEHAPFRTVSKALKTYVNSNRSTKDLTNFSNTYTAQLKFINGVVGKWDGKRNKWNGELNYILERRGVESAQQRNFIIGSYMSLFQSVLKEAKALPTSYK